MASATSNTGRGGTVSPGPQLIEDELFEVLANRRRRYVVHALKGENPPAELGTLAEQVAAWENDVAVTGITSTERKRVYTALQQSHLPKMDNAGVVDFDKDRGVIEPAPALEDVDVYMDVVRGDDIPWSEYYLGLSGVAAALITAVWLGTWPFLMLPDVAWGTAIVVTLSVSALVHWYRSRRMQLGGGDRPPEIDR